MTTIVKYSAANGVNDEALFQRLLASPRLSLLVNRLEKQLADETKKRQEFYAMINEGDKAEFINGEMIFHSPVKMRHNVAAKRLLILLDVYVTTHDLGFVGYEKIMVSLTRNDYEPDLCFFVKAKAQTFSADQMRFPAPDFVVEVLSTSTEENDRGVKFDDYAAHGVTEYWIIDPIAETVEQYQLQEDGRYELLIKAKTGQVQSITVADFEIPVRAIFDEAENRAALQTILAR